MLCIYIHRLTYAEYDGRVSFQLVHTAQHTGSGGDGRPTLYFGGEAEAAAVNVYAVVPRAHSDLHTDKK